MPDAKREFHQWLHGDGRAASNCERADKAAEIFSRPTAPAEAPGGAGEAATEIPAEHARAALDAAIWVTCSPHEWVWTHDQQIAMARYCIEAAKHLAMWRWLTEMQCTVQRNSDVNAPPWTVLDVDNEILGQGNSPLAAIADAKVSLTRKGE